MNTFRIELRFTRPSLQVECKKLTETVYLNDNMNILGVSHRAVKSIERDIHAYIQLHIFHGKY